MFEAGQDYKFVTLDEGGDAVSWQGEVTEVMMPLIKVENFRQEATIINTYSPSFVSAVLQPYRSPEQKAEARESWTLVLDDVDRNA